MSHRSRPSPWEPLLPLEPRTLLSTVQWDAGGDGVHWSDAANWSGDVLPQPNDAVVINVSPDPTIVFDLPSAKVKSITSREHFRLESGTLTVWQEWRQAAALDIAGGSLAGAGNLVLSAAATWTGGDLVGPGKVQIVPGGSLDIAGSPGVLLSTSRPIINDGALTWSGGDLGLVNTAFIRSLPGRTFDISSPFGTLRRSGTTARLEVGGTLNLSGPSITFDAPVFCTRADAQINAGAAFQQFRSIGANDTPIDGALANCANLTLAPNTVTAVLGDFKLLSQSTLSGSGAFYLLGNPQQASFQVISGTVNHAGLFQISGTRAYLGKPATFSLLDLRNATLTAMFTTAPAVTAAGLHADHGTLESIFHPVTIGAISGTSGLIRGSAHILESTIFDTWTLGATRVDGNVEFIGFNNAASLEGAGSALIHPGATLRFAGNLGHNLINRGTLDLYGPVTLQGVTLLNEAQAATSGFFTVFPFFQSGGAIGGAGSIINQGTFDFASGAAGGTIDGPILDNTGTIIVRRSLTVPAAKVVQVQQQTLAGGTWILDWSPTGIPQTTAARLDLTGADIRVNRAAITVRNSSGGLPAIFPALLHLERNDGVIEADRGTALTFLPTQGLFTNANTIRIGSNSSISVNGWYTQLPSAELALTANNPTARAHLDATGQITLAGRLNISLDASQGAPPIAAPGTFAVLLVGSQRSGQFGNVLLPPVLPPGLISLNVQYDATSVRLNYA